MMCTYCFKPAVWKLKEFLGTFYACEDHAHKLGDNKVSAFRRTT